MYLVQPSTAVQYSVFSTTQYGGEVQMFHFNNKYSSWEEAQGKEVCKQNKKLLGYNETNMHFIKPVLHCRIELLFDVTFQQTIHR